MMISWDACRREFEPDGALRDIYVLDTTIEHWRKLFVALRGAYTLEYSVDGESRPIPETVDEALGLRATANPSLFFRVAGIGVACHFFCTEQIELDIQPREVNSTGTFDDVLGLLRLIGDTVGKRVIMTHESDEQHPFIIYEPSTKEFEHRG